MKNKVCLVSSIELPIPNVKGGAIETLITNLIEENEINNKIDLTVISIYDEKAEILSRKYKNTKFIYININYIDKLKKILYKIIKKVTGKKVLKLHSNSSKAVKKIGKGEFDYIIAEGGLYHSFKILHKIYKKEQLIAHIHHHYLPDEQLEQIFGEVIAISDFIKKEWILHSKNSQNICVLKNGIDIQKFTKRITEEEKQEIRKKYGFKKEDFLVLFCGRLIKEKGIKELILAIKKIDNPHIKLLIIGSPHFAIDKKSVYLSELENLVKENSDKIKFTGYIENHLLYKYYQIANIMVIPSIWEEAAGLVSIEGMASGLPLIVTNSGGLVEYIDDKTAIIVEKDKNIINNLENGIIFLQSQKDKREYMSRESEKRAMLFTKEKYYQDFCELLQRIKKVEK